jgi:muramidase (phage lysozyme)
VFAALQVWLNPSACFLDEFIDHVVSHPLSEGNCLAQIQQGNVCERLQGLERRVWISEPLAATAAG